MALEAFDYHVPKYSPAVTWLEAMSHMEYLQTHSQSYGTSPSAGRANENCVRIWGTVHVDERSDEARAYLSKLAGQIGEMIRLRKRIAWRKANQLEDVEESSGLQLDIPEEWM